MSNDLVENPRPSEQAHLNALERVEEHPLAVKPEEESLLAFFTVDAIGHALNVSNWTIEEEIRVLSEIARGLSDNGVVVKTGDRIRAMDAIRKLVRDSLRMNGLLTSETKVATLSGDQGEDGQVRVISSEKTMKLSSESLRNSEAALKGLQPPPPSK